MALIRCFFSWVNPVDQGHQGEPHAHDCTEIVYSQESAGVLSQRNRAYSYKDQSIFIYQPGTTHWVDNTKTGLQCCIGLVGCQSEHLKEGVLTAGSALSSRFGEIIEVLKSAKTELQQSRLELLAGLVVCDLLAEQSKNRVVAPSKAERIRLILEDTLTEPIVLEDLAEAIRVGRDYLRQLFREEFKESITHYVLRRRIELACQILANSNDPVKEVAAQTGFANEYYFSRAFTKVIGISPSRWRAARQVISA